jgi:hypothetical protein
MLLGGCYFLPEPPQDAQAFPPFFPEPPQAAHIVPPFIGALDGAAFLTAIVTSPYIEEQVYCSSYCKVNPKYPLVPAGAALVAESCRQT